jgi:hypothetical protein
MRRLSPGGHLKIVRAECVAVDGIYADAGPGFMFSRRTTPGHSLSLPSQRPVLLAQPSQRSVKMLRLEVGP